MHDERQRMAGEIHDTLAQGLTGIITQLEAADRAAGRPDAWRRHLDQARALARTSLSEARRSVQALRPEPLEEAGLPEALAEMASRWSETSTVALSFDHHRRRRDRCSPRSRSPCSGSPRRRWPTWPSTPRRPRSG